MATSNTTSHLDPRVLAHNEPSHPGDIPSLGIDPNAQIRATPISTTGSLTAQNPISLGDPQTTFSGSGNGRSQAVHGASAGGAGQTYSNDSSAPAASADAVSKGNLYAEGVTAPSGASAIKDNTGVAPSTLGEVGEHDLSAINRSLDGAPNAKIAGGSSGGNVPGSIPGAGTSKTHALNNTNTGTGTGSVGKTTTTGDISKNVSATANAASKSVSDTTNTLAAKARESAAAISENMPTTTGVRQRVNVLGDQLGSAAHQAADHPVVKDAKDVATKQVGQFREFLGNFPIVKDLEKRTGVDRVVLVAGGVVAYLLLVPLNLFGLALPVTQFLTFVPPAYVGLEILDRAGDHANAEPTKALLAYFVVLGLIQFTESLAPGILSRRIPQYWTVKLLFLAWLLHPQTMGALKIHNNVLRRFVAGPSAESTTTPPTSKPSFSTHNSPTFGSTATSTAVPGQNIPKVAARGEGFEVISELRT